MDFKKIAKDIIDRIPDLAFKNLAESDCEFFVNEFLYEVRLDPSSFKGDDISPEGLKEEFKERFLRSQSVFGVSSLVSELWDTALKVNLYLENEVIEYVIDLILESKGYSTINQCILKLGWTDEIDKAFADLSNELKEFREQ